MKRLNYIISGLLSISISLSSCDEFLNVEPSDARTIQYFYTNPKEAQQALMGVYNGLLPISSYYLMLSDVRSDDVWTGMPMITNKIIWPLMLSGNKSRKFPHWKPHGPIIMK